MNCLLRVLAFCETKGLLPVVTFTGPNYRDGDTYRDWFGDYFDGLILPGQEGCLPESRDKLHYCRVSTWRDIAFPSKDGMELEFERGARLIAQGLRVKTQIITKVDGFAEANFIGRVLGIHFRGTDKGSEASEVSSEEIMETVQNYLNVHHEIETIFLGTDVEDFVGLFKERFAAYRVCFHEDSCRSNNGVPVHRVGKGDSNYLKGEDAIINCLLLSRCDAIVRTCSLLSAWAILLNADIKNVTVNRPLSHSAWFPEKEITDRSEDHYLSQALVKRLKGLSSQGVIYTSDAKFSNQAVG
jgi:hypothetical protein